MISGESRWENNKKPHTQTNNFKFNQMIATSYKRHMIKYRVRIKGLLKHQNYTKNLTPTTKTFLPIQSWW